MRRLASAQRSYVDAVTRRAAVNSFLDKFELGKDEARLLDQYNFDGFLSPAAGQDSPSFADSGTVQYLLVMSRDFFQLGVVL